MTDDAPGDRVRVATAALLVVLLPVALGRVVWVAAGSDGPDPNLRVAVTPVDVASIAALLLWARWHAADLRSRLRHPGLLGGVLLALAGLELLALAAHPSIRGVDLLLRVAAAAAVADIVRRVVDDRWRSVLLAVVVVVGSAQAVLAMAQSRAGRVLGIPGLELDGYLYTFGSSTAGRGGFGHPYHLASFLVVACSAAALGVRRHAHPLAWAVGLVVCAAGVAVTFSRAAVLGLGAVVVLTVVAAVARRDRRAALVALVLVVGLAVGGTAFGDGWRARSAATSNAASVDSGRRDRAAEAVRLARTEPLVGVGPGRYVIALRDVRHQDLLPAHDLPLQVGAEAGILAGVLAAIAFLALGWRSLVRGLDSLLVFVPLAPLFLLDAYPYALPGGIALSGIWLGLLGAGWSGRRADGDVPPRAAYHDEATADRQAEAVPA